jgi:predicted DNA-binding transcriptional regulator AlpA
MPDTLPLPNVPEAPTRPEPGPKPEPLAVDIRYLSHLLSTSVATLWRWDASGTLGPQGIKRGGKKLFRLAEVREWVSQGMPDRRTWQTIQASKNGNGRPW